jgi:phospholipid/cholesterol/gamma-HCH transport system ATP-binding protein
MMIKLVNLYKDFDDNQVLRGVDLEIKKGESMAVIGRSGSGKSVLLKHIIGLMKPDRGKIIVDGVDVTALNGKDMNEFRKRFGMLFQGAALFDSMTIGDNVAFPLREHTKMHEREIKEKVKEKLELVGLKNVENLFSSELSGGMKKRVGLARAIAIEPQILLYDEPTAELDPVLTDSINGLIVEMREKLNVTTVVITHDMVSAYKIADRIAMLYQGKIIALGTPDEIKNSENPVVKQFVTGSAAGPISVK